MVSSIDLVSCTPNAGDWRGINEGAVVGDAKHRRFLTPHSILSAGTPRSIEIACVMAKQASVLGHRV